MLNIMSDYKMTIGLEIHAELKTKSKMFCSCLNVSAKDAVSPNAYICPVCMGYPGTLPVINKEAVKKVLMVGLAVNGNLADFTEFDRKNYFYPDIPKGYQISQYKYPLVSGGSLSNITLTRIHLEEDTARSSHEEGNSSFVDFNRAGVPLMELVTEPVIHSADEAYNFARELQLLLQYLKVSDANMEKGEMRVEVNISVAKEEPIESNRLKFGTKVEIKNLNSFRAVAKSIEFEFDRQTSLLDRGDKVVQETRGWDEKKEITFSQRLKESAHDYRYFPEPDLPKIFISKIEDFKLENLKKEMPELPSEKRLRYLNILNLKKEDVEFYINNKEASNFFESVIILNSKIDYQTISNYITSDLAGLSKNEEQFSVGKITPDNFTKIFEMINNGELSSRGAKDIIKIMFEFGGNPQIIAKEKNLIQKNNEDELKVIINKIIDQNPKVVQDFKSGKESVIQFFVGQGMKETKGSANPEILKKIVLEIIKNK